LNAEKRKTRVRRAADDDVGARLPLDDPHVDRLDEPMRRRVGVQWVSRATAELRVASIFAVVSRDLLITGADPAVLRIASRAVSDEVRHAEICRLVAERYLRKAVPWPKPGPVPMPALARGPAKLRPTLHVVAMGCINETIATAWLETSRAGASSPLARAAIRELLSDDVHHARLGWAHVASTYVTTETRGAIGAWLGKLLDAAASPWLRSAPATIVEGCPAHGVPSVETTRRVVRETVADVVLPGLEHVGVPVDQGRAWLERTFGAS
jgi:hypothetical protein